MNRTNPFREMQRMMNNAGNGGDIDVRDHGDSVAIVVELSGYSKDSIDLQVDDGQLTIKASEETHTGSDSGFSESYRSVSRTISLPQNVDYDSATANYRNGILEVVFEKTDTSEGHIQVN